ncbi:MAG: class I SAM-dependent methyltransferase, partial [Bacilli bacterium]|nr:class I SAM-dependent methyltransferase [Bacilli bacterium]
AIGDYPKYLTEKCNKNFEVIGVDSSENMIKVAMKNAPKADFQVMDMRYLEFPDNSFNAIICLATLIHVDDNTALSILEKFDSMLKDNGLIIINVMEHINGDKEIYEKEPFNPKYNTYFNRYSKSFFINWFKNNNYEILNIIDNPIFNSEKVKEPSVDTNQFSIIVKRK